MAPFAQGVATPMESKFVWFSSTMEIKRLCFLLLNLPSPVTNSIYFRNKPNLKKTYAKIIAVFYIFWNFTFKFIDN